MEQREYDENALGTEWTLNCVHLYERLVRAQKTLSDLRCSNPCSLMLRAVEPRVNVEHIVRVQWTVRMKQPFPSRLYVVVVSGFSPRNELE